MQFSFDIFRRRGYEAVEMVPVPKWWSEKASGHNVDKPRRPYSRILGWMLVLLLVVLIPACLFFIARSHEQDWTDEAIEDVAAGHVPEIHGDHSDFSKRQLCRGPRGLPLKRYVTDDLPRPVFELPGDNYSNNTYGSYEALNLQKTWMTFEQRYGPYGYNEDDASYKLSRADWSKVDWAVLQDECAAAQPHNPYSGNFIAPADGLPRMRYRDQGALPAPFTNKTGRQAIVIRTWTGFTYTDEDKWNLRSIINEAALSTSAEYTVYLLVHVKLEDGAEMYTNPGKYEEILKAYVPKEFQKIAVLFHKSLLVNWYPKVKEYAPFFQIMQPMQLFAEFYPEYDHYWQLEMDTRFTGHVGDMLQSFDEFGKSQPYKQSRERASWTYISEAHGTYEEFTSAINDTLKGGANIWGPEPKKSVGPFMTDIGIKPPVDDPKNDNFEWRVGVDPHLLLLERVIDPARFEVGFVFRDWFAGFDKGTPRLHSPNAQCRVSRELLQQVHAAQVNYGVRLPGESTMPTFALWNGFQIVHVPMPKYLFQPRDARELGWIHNGGRIDRVPHGIANAVDVYNRLSVNFYARPSTFNFKSSLPGPAFQRWLEGGHFGPSDSVFRSEAQKRPAATEGEIPDGLPEFMREVDGKVYMPNMLMHPRKSYVKYA